MNAPTDPTSQEALIKFLKDPATLRAAAEGSMEKRRRVMYGDSKGIEFERVNADKLTAFMERQGWSFVEIQPNLWGWINEDGSLVSEKTAQHWYAEMDRALALVEHPKTCSWIRHTSEGDACECGAIQINALLTERRREAGLDG